MDMPMISLPPPLTVRPATPSDAAFEETLYRSTRADLLQLDAAPAMVEQLLAMQWQVHRDGLRSAFPDAHAWIVLQQTVPVAQFVVLASPSGQHLLELIVLPQVRRQGLGRQILLQLQRGAADAGQSLTLRVAHNNAAARKLYVSLGFQSREDSAALDFMTWRA
jgi:ribosomal protein S18 acetylase RimI-like enzyme